MSKYLKNNALSFLPLVPALAAIFDRVYLPQFHIGQYFQLLAYLQFRAYVFLLLFVATDIVTLVIVTYRANWSAAILGIAFCLVPLNLVYLWSSDAVPRLNVLFYVTSENPPYRISSPYYDWLTLSIAILIVSVAATQAYKSRGLLPAIAATGMWAGIALFPLPLDVYLWDREEIGNHVTNIMLLSFTNEDLLLVSASV